MSACVRGPRYAEEHSNVTLCSWGDDPGNCVFRDHPVPITDIKAAQKRVHSEKTKDAILRCERETTSYVPFFSLEKTDFGHPMYDGVFPACTNATELLKIEVGKLALRDDQNRVVDDTSATAVNALYDTLSKKSMRYKATVNEWAKAWHKDNLVEERELGDVEKHHLLQTKCLGADTDFQNYYKVR